MSVRRTVLLLVPALIAGTPLAAAVVPAQAATQISPPTITPANFPPVPVGKPVTFTLTGTGVGTVAFEYAFNGARD